MEIKPMHRIFFTAILLTLTQFSFGQSPSKLMPQSVTVYALPKHSKYKFRVTEDRIKNLSDVKKTLITDDKKIFDYLRGESFVGKAKPDFKEIDVRLLIEITDTDGKTKKWSVSSTNLIQVDSDKVCELLNYKEFTGKLKKYIPSKSGW
ncbi:MAG TPA: hypothetical protein VL728_03950 [Cyclobacteriaceae bacterium]|jgi:hypothetical protein|nr:hypothetical protein [Cyclobacteriaceae bacterium]